MFAPSYFPESYCCLGYFPSSSYPAVPLPPGVTIYRGGGGGGAGAAWQNEETEPAPPAPPPAFGYAPDSQATVSAAESHVTVYCPDSMATITTGEAMPRELPLHGGQIKAGTPVTLTVMFEEDDHKEVYASFTRPGEARAVFDPGFGKNGSRIRHPLRRVYTYVIDTTGFRTGTVKWRLWAPDEAPQDGSFEVEETDPHLG